MKNCANILKREKSDGDFMRLVLQNKIFGDADDIIFNSVSNGFVKP
jgi:hypothetical protein